jgi:hypothetical protein
LVVPVVGVAVTHDGIDVIDHDGVPVAGAK